MYEFMKVFEKKGLGKIRVFNIKGEPYAVGVDVARALEYANPSKAVIDHCKGISKIGIPSNGGEQQTNVIPEGDIYRLIIKAVDQSKSELVKMKASDFEKLVFEEVLPSIRKHGMYATEITIEKMLNDPDFAIKLLTNLKEEKQKRLEAERRNAILMHVNKTYTATEIAKELGFKSATALNNVLAEKKIQYKQNETWVLYSKYADRGYVEIKQEVLDTGKVLYHRRWTQLGREFLLNLLLK